MSADKVLKLLDTVRDYEFKERRAGAYDALREILKAKQGEIQDPGGTVLEGILLAVGPVGAGINLELLHRPVRGDGGRQQRSAYRPAPADDRDSRTAALADRGRGKYRSADRHLPASAQPARTDWRRLGACDRQGPRQRGIFDFRPGTRLRALGQTLAAVARTRPLGRLVSRPYRPAVAGVDR